MLAPNIKPHIKPKRDFGDGPGFWMKGKYVKSGFVVTDGFCNIMPGAVWFQTIPDALEAIDCLRKADNSNHFWMLMGELRLQKLLENSVIS